MFLFLIRCPHTCCGNVHLVDDEMVANGWRCPSSAARFRIDPATVQELREKGKGVTETDWLSWSEPETLSGYFYRRTSTRKHELFAAACRKKRTIRDFFRKNRKETTPEEKQLQCDLIRDLFGNPFRPVTIDPAWLTWNDSAVPKLAQAIYDERRFGDLPRLANLLEQAGCDNADILAHCREPGEHVRGCWALDLLLGKH